MQIKDVTEDTYPGFACCFEDWSEDMQRAGAFRRAWFEYMEKHGLGAKVAIDDDGTPCGMIQYIPSKYSFIQGDGIYLITCIWVYGYDKGIGNRQKRGMGKALLLCAEEDAKSRGAKGMAAWGLTEPYWMQSSFYKKFGYAVADTKGTLELVWKPFVAGVQAPEWRKPRVKQDTKPDKVLVTAFSNGWCPANYLTFEAFKKAASEFAEKVEFSGIDTMRAEDVQEWGITDGIYINGRELGFGPPLSYEDARRIITGYLRELG